LKNDEAGPIISILGEECQTGSRAPRKRRGFGEGSGNNLAGQRRSLMKKTLEKNLTLFKKMLKKKREQNWGAKI
jgi:hypothetical protein